MKKKISLILVFTLIAILSISFVACGKKDTDSKQFSKNMTYSEILLALTNMNINSATYIYEDSASNYSNETKASLNEYLSISKYYDEGTPYEIVEYYVYNADNRYQYYLEFSGENKVLNDSSVVNEKIDNKGLEVLSSVKTDIYDYLVEYYQFLLKKVYDIESVANQEFEVEVLSNNSFKIVYGTETYTLKDINNTTIQNPYPQYEDTAALKTVDMFSSTATYATFQGLYYSVRSYQIPDTYNDNPVRYANFSETMPMNITIPTSVENITGTMYLGLCSSVTYLGTKEQFAQITLSIKDSSIITVHCQNGDYKIMPY